MFNNEFISLISPTKVLKKTIVAYLILLIIAPIKYQYFPSIEAILYIFFCILSFYFGTKIKTNEKKPTVVASDETIIFGYYASLCLSIVGIILKLYDRFLIRGLSFSLNFIENRTLLNEIGSNIFSIIGSILFLLSLAPIAFIYFKKKIHFRFKPLAYLVFIYLIFEGILLSSRFSILIVIYYSIFYFLIFKKNSERIFNTRNYLVIIFLIYLTITFSSYLFLDRANTMNISWDFVIQNSGFAKYVPVSNFTFEFLNKIENNSLLFYFCFGLINIVQYILHGLFEFGILYEFQTIHNVTLYGKNEFFIFFKFFNSLFQTGFNIENLMEQSEPHIGVFTTFFGPLFIDFKWGGIVLIFMFGKFTKIIWHKVQQNDIFYLPMYLFLLLIIILMPILNYIPGTGTMALVSFSLILLLKRRI